MIPDSLSLTLVVTRWCPALDRLSLPATRSHTVTNALIPR